jgi:hypothetical protein
MCGTAWQEEDDVQARREGIKRIMFSVKIPVSVFCRCVDFIRRRYRASGCARFLKKIFGGKK